MNARHQKPAGFESALSEFKPCFYDSGCGKPVAWGFKLIQYLSAEKFELLRSHGELACDYSGSTSTWFFIVKRLTREDAIKIYGDVTSEEFGPRGGWKSVTFGTTTFFSRELRRVQKKKYMRRR